MAKIHKILLCLAMVLLVAITEGRVASADHLLIADAGAMSGDPEKIRSSVALYETLDTENAEVQWRLIRAYFNYYDELTDRNRREDQKWAAETGYAFAEKALRTHPDHAKIVYYYALIGLCYLDFHRLKALFLIDDLLDAFEKTLQRDPNVDDAGPDRNLGLLYYQLPGWPFSKGDKEKAMQHLQSAAGRAPNRAANRLPLAKALAEQGRFEEGWGHIQFIRSGSFEASSDHWRAIYLRRVEEVADAFPQNQK